MGLSETELCPERRVQPHTTLHLFDCHEEKNNTGRAAGRTQLTQGTQLRLLIFWDWVNLWDAVNLIV